MFMTVSVGAFCQRCKKLATISIEAVDEFGFERFFTKCRYCGETKNEGPAALVYLMGLVAERTIEYLQFTNPVKISKEKNK